MHFFHNEYLLYVHLEKRQLYFSPLICDILHILTQQNFILSRVVYSTPYTIFQDLPGVKKFMGHKIDFYQISVWKSKIARSIYILHLLTPWVPYSSQITLRALGQCVTSPSISPQIRIPFSWPIESLFLYCYPSLTHIKYANKCSSRVAGG